MGKPTILPPGIAPPLTEDNDHNHNALIVIVASLSLFLALVTLAIRTYATVSRGLVLKDDYVLVSVVVFACAQVSVALNQVHYGWGKSEDLISSDDYIKMTKTGLAVDVLYIIVIGLSKICTMMFYRTLCLRDSRLTVHIILGGCVTWIVLGMVLLTVRCSNSPWEDINGSCDSFYPRWQTICGLDIILEMVILAYPIKILHNLQITLLKKIKVQCILSCRFVLIPISTLHLTYINTQATSGNPSLDGAYASTIAELHIGLSVVLLTVSSLKIFLAAYEDEEGLAYTEDASKSRSHSARGTKSRTLQASNPARDAIFAGAWYDDLLLQSSAWVSSSGRPLRGFTGGNKAIMKSVKISVTSESIDLEERGETSASASASGAL